MIPFSKKNTIKNQKLNETPVTINLEFIMTEE